ncbi:hypothetical protein EKO04_005263 [Ascochyta lentis]|uniref:Uncharacterized protein n=1 Tax=Ascochyta lentis TaxID=205686 RepID=A0A8H7J4K3_9PLEO|nr:hypothetical protein EKO04_005263 [Ascochyta lentis]
MATNFSKSSNRPANTPHSPAAVPCGRDDMTVNGEVKRPAMDRDDLRRGLVTSSTKARIESLARLEHQVADESLVPADLQALLATLFETYPLYDDRESRRAVEAVLRSLINGPHGDLVLPAIVKFLGDECQKKGIAHVNAFVLVDWCSALLVQFAKQPERWSKFGLHLALADARVLETCVAAGSDRRAARISHSALVVTRRALRALLGSKDIGQHALDKLVANLTA